MPLPSDFAQKFNSIRILIVCLNSFVLIAFLFGGYVEYVQPRRNMCAMTYMYQQPEYTPIALDKHTLQAFPVYNLYVYGEGSYARRLRSKRFEGIPVLFLPGNSGSYKQVRSLASVSMTKAESTRSPFHFDYFAADFNEELSALYGHFLFKQTEFTSICIKVILGLYRLDGTSKPPKSVIIVGHSMGGMIARAVFTQENFNPSTIQLIMTQATPHSGPVFTPDSYVYDFYDRVNRHWHKERNSSLRHVNLVSISGGREDRMVRSDLGNLGLKSQVSLTRDIYVMTNAIPGVWVGTDHLCIVWCKQLVLAIVRTTFKLIESDTKQLISDSETRHRSLTRLLVEGAHIKSHSLRLAANWAVPMSYENLWTSRLPARWEYKTAGHDDASTLLMVVADADRIGQLDRKQHLFIATLNVNLEPWIFTCTPDGDVCHVTGVPTSCQTIHLPSTDGARRVFRCSEMDSKHFVIKLPSEGAGKVEVFAEIFNPADRTVELHWSDLIIGGVHISTAKNSLVNTVTLPSFSETWETYRVQIKTSGRFCTADSFAGVVHLSVPWSAEDTFETFDRSHFEGVESSIVLLHSNRPLRYSGSDAPEIRVYNLNPNCEYKISVHFSLFDALAQVIRYYIYTCPAFVAAAALHSLSSCLTTAKSTENYSFTCVPLITLIISLGAAYAVTTLLNAWTYWIGIQQAGELAAFGLVPELYQRWWSVPIVLFVYVASSVAVTASIWVIRVVAFAIGKILSTLGVCLSLRSNGSGVSTSSRDAWIKDFLCNAALLIIVLVVGHFVCGAATTLITVLILILRSNGGTSKGDLHLVCKLVWLLIFMFACPTLIVRMVNFRTSVQFVVDPSLMQSYFMAIILFFGQRLSLDELHRQKPFVMTLLSGCQSVLATGILVFGVEHVHRIPWFLIADCLLLSFWKLISKMPWQTSGAAKNHED